MSALNFRIKYELHDVIYIYDELDNGTNQLPDGQSESDRIMTSERVKEREEPAPLE